jgi:serine/threonine protein phosphatase 1
VPAGELMIGRNHESAGEGLRAAVPEEHLKFLASLQTSITVGKYFLCHAGVRPGVPLERQSIEDLLLSETSF